MRRVTLYSQSRAPRAPARSDPPGASADVAAAPNAPSSAGAPASIGKPLHRFIARHERPLLVAAGAAAVALALFLPGQFSSASRVITQEDIDKAVLHTLATKALPSPAARAHEVVRGAVVRVSGVAPGERGDADIEEGVGSGVVIVDTGMILTNLHVVLGSEKVRVVFADGLESDATVVGTQPEHDLAVLKAKTVPDDLVAATLRSTADLAPGDQVVAVGFPFGIGPSTSAGVISGLQREFRSPQGKRVLTNLIQFDAAANPGNSGGPLVTMEGEVVGIVTGILNPTEHRVFIGIGFAVPIENAASALGVHPF